MKYIGEAFFFLSASGFPVRFSSVRLVNLQIFLWNLLAKPSVHQCLLVFGSLQYDFRFSLRFFERSEEHYMLTHKLVQKSIGSQIREPNRTENRRKKPNR